MNSQYEKQNELCDSDNKQAHSLGRDLKEINDKHMKLNNEVMRLDKEFSSSKSKTNYQCLELEARSRRQNLVFHGMEEEHGENCCTEIKTYMNGSLEVGDVQIHINRAHRIGP